MSVTRTPSAASASALVVAREHLLPGRIFNEFGSELTHAHVMAALRELLGPALIKLAEHAGRHADDPTHLYHQDLHEAASARLRGTWHIARYNAPIESYAAAWATAHGTQDDEEAVRTLAFHHLPEHIRVAADAAMKKVERAYLVTEFEETFDNLFTTQGVSTLWNQCANGGSANTGAAVPGQRAWYNNAQAVIGVGDSSTAAAATQFDLQAATNRLWVAMDATFPTLPGTASNQIILRSTFGTAQANYAWAEFAIANDNGSNVAIPGSAARAAANGSLLDRVVSAQGTKASGQTWQPSMTLSIA